MGWEKNKDGKYEFNTNNIELNVSESNKMNGNASAKYTIITNPFFSNSGPISVKTFWNGTPFNPNTNTYKLYKVDSTSKQSTANIEISTDTRNTTYYILLEKE